MRYIDATGLPEAAPAVTGATVRLANARVEQAVVGGTVRLATSTAVPPGLWMLDTPPGPERVVALYVPLRAIVGGWSGTTGDGWQKIGQQASGMDSRDLVTFETTREWFPAHNHGQSLRLHVQIGASSFAEEGRTRRGFTYRVGDDPPMEVLEAGWRDGSRRRDLPCPQIQLMAPPRVQRISDFDERITRMDERAADRWARQGEVQGLWYMPDETQQRTPVGRGIPLQELAVTGRLMRFAGVGGAFYRVQIRNPLRVRAGDWRRMHDAMHAEAARLGLDLGTDAVVEWWLDQHGHDGALFERGAYPGSVARTAVVFRRNQIAEIANGD